VLISSQPTGEAVCERLGRLGEVKYDSKNNSATILMVVEDRCPVSALVEPYAHRAHLIAKIGPIKRDFHRVHIPNRGNWNTRLCINQKTKHQFPLSWRRLMQHDPMALNAATSLH
jgi:hypothetical protein